MARAGNFAVPAISPREGGQWRMLADSSRYSDMTTDLDFWSNSLFSGGVRISPLRNWGSRGPGFKSRQPDHNGPGQAPAGAAGPGPERPWPQVVTATSPDLEVSDDQSVEAPFGG